MKLICYPNNPWGSDSCFLRSFLSKELKKYKHLQLAVLSFLEKIQAAETLEPFMRSEEVRYLKYEKVFEMRIPPQLRGGVVRVYFLKPKDDPAAIVLLDAELKKGRVSKIRPRVAARRHAYVNRH